MRAAPDITNVVEACNLDGRQERLENNLSQLEMCEKALQVGWLATQMVTLRDVGLSWCTVGCTD